jgi:hypothetical protein
MKRKGRAKAAPVLEGLYPNIGEWLSGGGQVVLGPLDLKRPFARAVFKGKAVWSGKPMCPTLDDAFAALDAGIRAYLAKQGYFAGDEDDE